MFTAFTAPPFILFAIAVESYGAATTSNRFSFQKIESLPLESSQQASEDLFGKPSKIYRDRLSDKIFWIYAEGTDDLNRYQRLSLTFSGLKLGLSGIHYYPLPPDAIVTVEGLEKHFPKANFKTVKPSSCGEHYTRNEGFAYDLASGISINREENGRVTGISISKPMHEQERKTASELNGCTDKRDPVELEEITPALR